MQFKRSIGVAGILAGLLTAQAFAAEVPADYTLLKTTAKGRAFAIRKEKPTKVADAIEAVLNDLDDYFDDDYDVYGAAENATDAKSGFATISAKYGGKPVRGIVTTRITDKGAVAIVIFVQADAPAAAWAELVGPAPKAAAAAATPVAGQPATQPAVAESKPARLTEYRFPDNTGTIGLADGWQPGPAGNGLMFDGPNDAHVQLGVSAAVNVPNSMAVQLARQYPVPGQRLLVAPFTGPAEAIANLTPQFSRFNQAAKMPAIEADHIEMVQQLPPQSQGSRWGIVRYGLTKTQNGKSAHYQIVAQVGLTPLTNESWMIYLTIASAQDADAAEQMPAMMAMIGSWRTNDAQIQQNTQQWIAGRQQWFAGQQAAHKTVTEGNDDYNKQWWAGQNTQSRAMDDFSEGMRGFRDIQDTRTGELNPADLGHVDQIIDQLNQHEPGRYKALPLKDKLDPKP